MASVISELRSVTFQSKSTTVFVSEINIQKHDKMAPQQHETLPKSSDFEVEQSQKSSPVSNLGTSVESSPPLLSNEETSDTGKQNKYEKIEDPSSNDSGSIHNFIVEQSEYQNPLMRLQSALGKDGRLGKKLCLSGSLSKNHSVNNWMTSTPTSMFERHLPTSTEIEDRSIQSSVIYHKSLATTSDKTVNALPSVLSSNCNSSGQSVPNGMYQGSLPSTSSGIYHENLESNSAMIFDPNNSFSCRVCDFTCFSKIEYDSHMNLHYTHKCPHCNYSSRTEGRLKRHVKEFHSDTPPESWAGTRTSRTELSNSEQLLDNSVTSSNSKARAFRCKHCSFVAYQKSDFWKHSKTHIKPDKLLQCEQCDFVTEFKHHYEYHIANHAGRKPFQCSMCNYKCVNKSMLNSHLKSHSNVYQFHCADCKYETKYCHSIKQHLKKQNHKPGLVLNQDGTPCPFQVIDVYGRRRGPRTKKRKSEGAEEISMASSMSPGGQQMSVPSTGQQSIPFSTAVSLLRPNIPAMYPSFYGDYPQSLMMRTNPQMSNSSFSLPMTGRNTDCFACAMCHFMTHDKELLKRHMMLHIASENQDIAKLYGINSEFFHDQRMALNNDVNGQRSCIDSEENEKKLFPSAVENTFRFQEDFRGFKREHEALLDDQNVKSEDGSSPKYLRISSPGNDENDSFKGYSSPSPTDSRSPSPDFVEYAKKNADTIETSTFMLNGNRMEDDDSPIDLSGRKSSDSLKMDRTVDGSQAPNTDENMLEGKLEFTNVSPSCQRNRRKGKAYKIDHYVQYDEQSSHQEFAKDCVKHDSIDSCKSNSEECAKKSCRQQSQLLPEASTVTSDEHQHKDSPKTIEEDSDLGGAKSPSNLCIDFANSPNVVNSNCSSTDNNTVAAKDGNSTIEHVSERTDDKHVKTGSSAQRDIYECHHCNIIFKDLAMYSVHMGYHGYMNPFQCNLCGQITANAVEFFVHIARVSHI